MKKQYVFAILAVVYLLMSIASALDGGDFDVYLDAGSKILKQENIYAPPFVKGLQYYYSPLFALILSPLAGLNIHFIIELMWLILSGLMLVRIWTLVSSYFDISNLTHKEYYWWVGISFFLILRFILYNIAMIQVTVFLLWMFLEGLRLVQKKQFAFGAAILALIINIKLMPIVVIPYLIYRGYFKAVGYTILFIVAFLILPGIFIGFDYNMFLHQEWWKIINPSNAEHVLEAEITYQSLVGMIPVFITSTESIIALKRNFLDLPVDLAILITNVLRLAVAGLTIYFMGMPFRKKVDALSEIRAIAYLLMAIPLIFPHQQKYAFLFFLPSIIYLVYYIIQKRKVDQSVPFKLFIAFFVLITIVFTPIIGSDIIGRYTYDVIQHYRILGICAFLFIPLLVIAKPAELNKILENQSEDK